MVESYHCWLRQEYNNFQQVLIDIVPFLVVESQTKYQKLHPNILVQHNHQLLYMDTLKSCWN